MNEIESERRAERNGAEATELRLAGLLRAVEIDGAASEDVHRILARHPARGSWPDAAIESRPHDAARSLRRLLVEELVSLESQVAGHSEIGVDCDEMSPTDYFLRRRRLSRVLAMKAAADRLPRVWTILGALPATDVTQRCLDVGVDALALSIRGISRDRLSLLLAPLGRRVALAVLERRHAIDARERPAFEATLRGALTAATSTRERSRLAAYVGRRCVATLHRGLAPLLQDEFARICRSNLPQKLEGTPPIPVAPEDRAWIESVVRHRVLSVFGDDDAGGGEDR